MPESRTYTKWKKVLKEEFLKTYKGNNTTWNYAESVSQDIAKLLQGRNFDKDAKNAMLYGFYDPIVGLRGAEKKMKDWDSVVNTVEGICVRPDDSIFRCPENVTTEERLLYKNQDSALLLLSILFLHEGVYKSIVNFIYNLTGHGKYEDYKTTNQAKYLAKAGLDIQRASDKELRNNIAHMSFYVLDSGDVWTNSSTSLPPGFDAASGKEPPGAVKYDRNQLISFHNESRAMLSDLFAATQHWFNCNHGPPQLFDDAFFETPESNEIRKKANAEMANRPSVDHWNLVMERARKDLQRVTGERA